MIIVNDFEIKDSILGNENNLTFGIFSGPVISNNKLSLSPEFDYMLNYIKPLVDKVIYVVVIDSCVNLESSIEKNQIIDFSALEDLTNDNFKNNIDYCLVINNLKTDSDYILSKLTEINSVKTTSKYDGSYGWFGLNYRIFKALNNLSINNNICIGFKSKNDLFRVIGEYKAYEEFRNSGNYLFSNTSNPGKRLVTPLLRDVDGLLPSSFVENEEIHNIRLNLKKYMESVSFEDKTVRDFIEEVNKNLDRHNINYKYFVTFDDFELFVRGTVDLSKVNKGCMRVIYGTDNLSDPYWEEIKFIGLDENKWFNIVTLSDIDLTKFSVNTLPYLYEKQIIEKGI